MEGSSSRLKKRPENCKFQTLRRKYFKLTITLALLLAGYIPDARSQVDHARFFAQSNRLIYDEPVDVEGVAKNIADMAQQFTQYAGVRPFGVALILAGVDETGASLYLTDPSGTYIGYDAVAIGAGSDQVTEYLEKSYKMDISLEECGSLAIESIYLVSEDKNSTRNIKMAVIDTNTKTMRKVLDEELEGYAKLAKQREASKGQ